MFVKHKSRPAAKALDIFPSGWYILSVFGEMSERFKEPVLKTGDGATHRGFESHSLRHNTAHCVCSGLYFLTWCLQEGETVDKMYADRETILALRVPGNLFRAAICKGCLNSVDKRILPVYNIS